MGEIGRGTFWELVGRVSRDKKGVSFKLLTEKLRKLGRENKG